MKKSSKRQIFKSSVGNVKLETIFCPKCYKIFGLDIAFIETVSETLFHFHCPYCEFEGSLRD